VKKAETRRPHTDVAGITQHHYNYRRCHKNPANFTQEVGRKDIYSKYIGFLNTLKALLYPKQNHFKLNKILQAMWI